jgi:hypothetical protein
MAQWFTRRTANMKSVLEVSFFDRTILQRRLEVEDPQNVGVDSVLFSSWARLPIAEGYVRQLSESESSKDV